MDWKLPYPSQRMPLLAQNVVATSQPLAAQAGLQALRAGGNAVDAAIATAITLTVVEPTSNGVGGDAFAIVWDGKELMGLNASGRSPRALTADMFDGLKAIPQLDWRTVTVPGQVSGWLALSERYGTLPFVELFGEAIRYAREGFAVSPITALRWQRSAEVFGDFKEFRNTFLPGGIAPTTGDIFTSPELADSLQAIADTRGEAFYKGALAEKLIQYSKDGGGFFDAEDLASHHADWVQPIAQDYRGCTLHEIPPNGQGIAALLCLGILRHFDLPSMPIDSAESVHLQIEAMKLAFADTHQHVADPEFMTVSTTQLLDEGYLQSRAELIDPNRAQDFGHGEPSQGGTVYLTTADASGMMVSYIQSNFRGFGSGLVVPGTGIALQNRGTGFSLDPAHPNVVGPGKRPFHTIIPGFVTRDGQPFMSFGVMGGEMQPQGHVQMVLRTQDHAQNPQAASDAPRWFLSKGKTVYVEQDFNTEAVTGLRSLGHDIKIAEPLLFGGAQLICRTSNGFVAGSDHRKDGQAVGF